MQLEFTIENQRLSRIDKNFVVEKTQNYLYAHFDFKTNDWNLAQTKYAVFTNSQYNDKNENALMIKIDSETNKCLVPYQILINDCSFSVNVIGVNSSGEYIITTNSSNVGVSKTGSTNGIHPDDPQPSFLQQLLEKIANSYTNFNFVYNQTNGNLTLTMVDNDGKEFSKVVDLPMEQVVKNVSYNESSKVLTIEWINGQKTEIDFSNFVDTYKADEKTLTLNGSTFSIKKEWIDEINEKIEQVEKSTNEKIGNLEEHTIEDTFYERMTASDSTGSKYEIKDGSIATPIKIGGMSYKSDNLQPREWSGLNDRIELNTTLKEGQSYTLCVNLPPTTGSRGLNLYDDKNNLLFSNEMTGWADPKSGWNSFVITAVTDTTSLRINAYGFEETSMQGAIYSGELVDKNKYNAINLYTPYFEGLRSTKVSAVESKGNNLLDTKKLIIRGTDFSVSSDGYVSDLCSSFNGKCFNSRYSTELSTVLSSNGILFKKGDYFISLKAKRNSGSGSLNAIFITLSNTKQKPATKVLFPNMSAEYQTYKCSFTLEEDSNIGLHIQVDGNASSMIFEIKDLMISKGNVEYQPYWEDRFEIPSEIQALDGFGLGINETYYNYIDFKRKVFVQNVMEIDLGDYAWYTGGTNTTDIKRMYTNKLKDLILKWATLSTPAPILCKGYSTLSAYDTYQKKIGISVDDTGSILIYDENYNTSDNLESFNAHVKGMKAIIALETPIETDISEYLKDYQYKVDNLGTEILVNEYQQKAPTEISYSVSLGQQIIENSDNIAKLNDGKLDKDTSVTSNPKVYFKEANGNNVTKNTTPSLTAWSIPYRDDTINFKVGDLTESSDGSYVANKNYVDNTAVAKVTSTGSYPRVYCVSGNGSQEMRGAIDRAIAWAIPYRNANNNFMVGDLTDEMNGSYVANKNYVDSIIAKQAKRIEQLEKASEGTILETIENEVETSYIRELGESTLPYTLLETLGGMTYKSENFLPIPTNVNSVSSNGITITFDTKTQTYTFSGTATSNVWFNYFPILDIVTGAPYGTGNIDAKGYYLNVNALNFSGGVYVQFADGTKTYTLYDMANTENVSNQIDASSDTLKRGWFYIKSGATVSGSLRLSITKENKYNMPYDEYFDGLRNSAVTEVVSNGANLLSLEDKETTTLNGVTYSIKNGVITFNGTATKDTTIFEITNYNVSGESFYVMPFGMVTTSNLFGMVIATSDWSKSVTFNYNNFTSGREILCNFQIVRIWVYSGAVLNNVKFKPMIVSGSTAPTEFKPYIAPTIKTIPIAITSIDGYGLGINETYYNYIDYERGVFVQNVRSIYLKDLSWSKSSNTTFDRFVSYVQENAKPRTDIVSDISLNDTSGKGDMDKNNSVIVINSSTQLVVNVGDYGLVTLEDFVSRLNEENPKFIYPLATPIETDISNLLVGFDNIIKVEGLGTITFENEHKQKVPNGITYQRRI